ncbi:MULTISPECIES: hypothetical protein [unclassified Azospirillum]|uniref:hypothetical protein n=1 Tax=unclassified Azospirillum TaxID=2630922 RepID=UPI000B6CEBEC|nr:MULTISPECIES: hypothetical protein [unclassified Azospirillum]SNS60854.1 hypothetical protein SAMN05880556_10840 [Azospirillum sp. RU38E]SNS80219.1 hypothetical protein SAMN05880591_10840 [Azospirillum sp. RU37A]
MSLRLMIIPEDFRKDEHILKPIFKALLTTLGKPRATVEVCKDPLLCGVNDCMKKDRLQEVFDRYEGIYQHYILCVDRDGDVNRRAKLNHLQDHFADGRVFLAANAWEELETWLLAGVDLPREWRWADIRADISVKENYFEKLARRRNVTDGLGGGRKRLGEEAARNLGAIRQKCREDFDELAQRLQARLGI